MPFIKVPQYVSYYCSLTKKKHNTEYHLSHSLAKLVSIPSLYEPYIATVALVHLFFVLVCCFISAAVLPVSNLRICKPQQDNYVDEMSASNYIRHGY